MNCVILQPSYIPWRGYFHQIYKADIFVFGDTVQYDKSGWRNRNRIKTANGTKWLTIPVRAKGHLKNGTPIKDVAICWDRPWNEKHWTALKSAYGKAPYFSRYAPMLEECYSRHQELLAKTTINLTVTLARELGIEHTEFVRVSDLDVGGKKTDNIIEIMRAVGANHYISGPSARNYLEEDKLCSAGFTLEYMTYDYPEYDQLYPPFEPKVSILDLLFMTGPQAPKYIWKR